MSKWQHSRDVRRLARKPHTCVLCELPIAAGEHYVRRYGFLDGPTNFAMHERCDKLTRDWDDVDWIVYDTLSFRESYGIGEYA